MPDIEEPTVVYVARLDKEKILDWLTFNKERFENELEVKGVIGARKEGLYNAMRATISKIESGEFDVEVDKSQQQE